MSEVGVFVVCFSVPFPSTLSVVCSVLEVLPAGCSQLHMLVTMAWWVGESGSAGVLTLSEVGVIFLLLLAVVCAGAISVSAGGIFFFFFFFFLSTNSIACSVLEVPPAGCLQLHMLFAWCVGWPAGMY